MQSSTNVQGWIIVGIGFLALGLTFSARAVLGLAMPLWEAEFGWSRSFVSTGGALALVMMAVMGPITGYVVDRFGSRLLLASGLALTGAAMIATAGMTTAWQFMVIYGVIGAIGFGLVSMNAVATASAQQFPDRVGLVSGISSSGSTGGQLLFVPIIAAAIAAWGWRSGYVAIGSACLALAPLVWLAIRPSAPRSASETKPGDGRQDFGSELRLILSNRIYLALLATFVICGVTTAGVIETHLLPYAAACGFPPLPSATAYGVLSAFNLLGMIIAGWLSDRVHRGRLLAIIYFVRALAFVLLMYIVADIQLLFLFAVIFGLFDYATVPVTAGLVAGHQIGAAAGAFMGGVLFDLFAQYQSVWLASIALAAVAGIIALLIKDPRIGAPKPA